MRKACGPGMARASRTEVSPIPITGMGRQLVVGSLEVLDLWVQREHSSADCRGWTRPFMANKEYSRTVRYDTRNCNVNILIRALLGFLRCYEGVAVPKWVWRKRSDPGMSCHNCIAPRSSPPPRFRIHCKTDALAKDRTCLRSVAF